MSNADWDIYLQHAVTSQTIRKDEVITPTPSQMDLYQVISGRVKYEDEGKVRFYEEGDVFGEAKMWEWISCGKELDMGGNGNGNIVALSKKADVLVLDGKYVLQSFSRNPRLRAHFLVFLCVLSSSRLLPPLPLSSSPLSPIL